ncbi:Predicted membrane protein [Nannocystis exedens]|uniref:Predicted membrane protein n=1 Tax=Nannocystis exedens TaxID=54 RepID=A0A1I1SW41_9BACT|nr:DUF2157 domain-containing protein [Nannocystis exedens]PCC66945.1 hypothetical protein NAEX_09544 [Nannocystis exedens]SFD50709.1 Predicted membrane protein [Nannocystis exedens]
MSDPLAGPPIAVRLHALASAGVLDPAAFERARELVGGTPTVDAWYRFARFHLIILGTVLAVAGAIFFVAANWDVFTPHARIGLAAAAMAAATLAGGWIGLDKLSGRAAGLAGGLLFGPLLALVGQVYQTGADAFELFLAWAVVLAGYALATRFVGAWITALLLAVITIYLWIGQALGSHPFDTPGLWGSLAGAAALSALALHRRVHRGPSDAIGLVALTLGWCITFAHGAVAISIDGWPFGQVIALLLALALPAVLLQLGRRLDDFGLERLAVAHLFGLLTVAEGKLVFDVLDAEIGGLLIMGLLLSVQGYVGGEWFRARRPREEDVS